MSHACACCKAGMLASGLVSVNSGHLFVLNCASILRVCLGGVCSSVHIFGEMSVNTLLFVFFFSVGLLNHFCVYVFHFILIQL